MKIVTLLLLTAVVAFSATSIIGPIPSNVAPKTVPRICKVIELPILTYIGDTAFVTDGNKPKFLEPILGDGLTVTSVFYNGVTWVAF